MVLQLSAGSGCARHRASFSTRSLGKRPSDFRFFSSPVATIFLAAKKRILLRQASGGQERRNNNAVFFCVFCAFCGYSGLKIFGCGHEPRCEKSGFKIVVHRGSRNRSPLPTIEPQISQMGADIEPLIFIGSFPAFYLRSSAISAVKLQNGLFPRLRSQIERGCSFCQFSRSRPAGDVLKFIPSCLPAPALIS